MEQILKPVNLHISKDMVFFKRKYSSSSKFTGWKTEKQVTSWLCMLIVRALSWDTTALRSCCCTMNHSCIWYRSHWNNVLFHGSFSKPRCPRSHKCQGTNEAQSFDVSSTAMHSASTNRPTAVAQSCCCSVMSGLFPAIYLLTFSVMQVNIAKRVFLSHWLLLYFIYGTKSNAQWKRH